MRVDKKPTQPQASSQQATEAPAAAAKARAGKAKVKGNVRAGGKAGTRRPDAFEGQKGSAQKKTVVLSPTDFADRSLSDLLGQLQDVAHELAGGSSKSKLAGRKVYDAKADARQKKLEKLEAKTGLRLDSEQTTQEGGKTTTRRFSAGLSGVTLGGGTTTRRTGPSTQGSGSKQTRLGQLDYAGSAAVGTETASEGSVRLDARGLTAQGSAAASLGASAQAAAHFSGKLGTADAAARAAARAYAQAQGDVKVGKKGLVATGQASAGVEARAEASASFQSVGIALGDQRLDLHGNVDAYAEAAARAEGKVTVAATLDPPRVEAEVGGKAFAGVKAGVEGTLGLGDFVTLSGHADAWAGAGAEAKGVLGYKDGVLRLSFNAGVAVGVGAGVGGEIDINVKKMAEAALEQAGKMIFGSRFDFQADKAVSNLRDLHLPLGEKTVTAEAQGADSRRLALQIVLATLAEIRPQASEKSDERDERDRERPARAARS